MQILFQELNGVDDSLVLYLVNPHIVCAADLEDEVVSEIEEQASISRADILSLADNMHLQARCIEAILRLFTARNNRILSAHKDTHGNGAHYTALKGSVFLNWRVLDELCSEEHTIQSISERHGLLEASKLKAFYFILQSPDDNECWILVVTDVVLRKIYYLDPKHFESAAQHADAQTLTEAAQTLLMGVKYALDRFILHHHLAANAAAADIVAVAAAPQLFEVAVCQPQCQIIKLSGGLPALQKCDSGVVALMLLYFLVIDCPVWCTIQDLIIVRKKFAYWASSGRLPM